MGKFVICSILLVLCAVSIQCAEKKQCLSCMAKFGEVQKLSSDEKNKDKVCKIVKEMTKCLEDNCPKDENNDSTKGLHDILEKCGSTTYTISIALMAATAIFSWLR